MESARPEVIAIYAPKPHSGKTTTALFFAYQIDGQIVSFATPFKEMLHTFLMNCGLSSTEADTYIEETKERPIPECCYKTTRHLMVTLGNTWGKQAIHKDIWIKIAMQTIDRFLANGHTVIVDDLRFLNELQQLKKKYKVLTVRVNRPSIEKEESKWKRFKKFIRAILNRKYEPSEGNLDNYDFDVVINNDSTEWDLMRKVQGVYNEQICRAGNRVS